jgi:hypothetical protein
MSYVAKRNLRQESIRRSYVNVVFICFISKFLCKALTYRLHSCYYLITRQRTLSVISKYNLFDCTFDLRIPYWKMYAHSLCKYVSLTHLPINSIDTEVDILVFEAVAPSLSRKIFPKQPDR